MSLSERFTLLLPTYNRPEELARLLRYLTRQRERFPVLVLDSSDGPSQERNADTVRGLDLDVRVLVYEPSISPWEKFRRGSEEATTEICSLCADDDLVVTEALPSLVDFLTQHADVSAAHGWYFSFEDHGVEDHRRLDIANVAYSGDSLDRADPLERVLELVRRYEAVTYAVYRTDVLRSVLKQAQRVQSLLARELLSGALTAVAGPITRLPLFYYGRSLRPSEAYRGWHPLEMLSTAPNQLMVEYAGYREILADALLGRDSRALDRPQILRLLDLVHLRYLSGYFTPEVGNYLVEELLAGTPRESMFRGLWPLLAPSRSPLLRRLRRSRRLRRVRDRVAPRVRLPDLVHALGLSGDRTVRAPTVGGRLREYRLHRDFLGAVGQPGRVGPSEPEASVLRALSAYE